MGVKNRIENGLEFPWKAIETSIKHKALPMCVFMDFFSPIRDEDDQIDPFFVFPYTFLKCGFPF